MGEVERFVRQAVKDFEAGMEMIGGCGDNHCYIRHHTSRCGGMGTNGGCKCWSDKMMAQRYMATTTRMLRDIQAALDAK